MVSRFSRLIALFALTVLVAIAGPAKAQSLLYVCDFGANKVTIHDGTTGVLLKTIPVSGPTGAEIGPDGYLYTVGYDGAIRRFNPTTGALMATLATHIATFPDDLHFGPDGNIYIACELGQGILRYDINGNPQPSSGNAGAVFFFGPNRFISTAFGKDGSVYATDYGSNTVWKFDPFGNLLGAFVNQNLHGPIDLRFGPDGLLYVANRDTNDVRRFDPSTGAFLGVFASNSGLDKSDSLDFGPDGNLYVGSRNTDAVIRFDKSTGASIDTFMSGNVSDPYRIRFFGTTSVKINSITPLAVKINSAAFQMTIDGTGFAANSTIKFNNTSMNVVSATTTRIVINVPAAMLTSKRVYNVIASTNGKLSNASPFRVTNDSIAAPPNFIIGPVFRTGIDPLSRYRYAVLLLENQGSSDVTTINLSTVRLYFDPNNANNYIQPIDVQLEAGALPPGTLADTAPGFKLQVRFVFPQTPAGPVTSGVISVVGTSDQGNFNAGSLFLLFPPSP